MGLDLRQEYLQADFPMAAAGQADMVQQEIREQSKQVLNKVLW